MRKFLSTLFVLLTTVIMSAPLYAQGKLNLGGCLIYSEANDYTTGIYSINGNGSLSPLTQAPEAWATGGGVMKDGVYYCTCFEEVWEGIYYCTGFAFDGQTWEQLETYDLGTDLSFVATDMTYDATTGKIYGCFYDSALEGFEFGTMEYGREMNIRETIAPLAVGYEVIAAAADGTLYAVDYEGNLVTVNKETGEGTVIGNTGLVSEYFISATIDQVSGDMYMTMLDDEGGRLYKINTATAAKTLVCTFENGEEITGLFTFDATTMDIPDVVSDLTANFDGNALTGTVTFTVPTVTISGNELAGELSYTVTANGEPVTTGMTSAGATVNAEITLPTAGNYEIAVFISNTAGKSKSVSTSLYVGDDIPAAVQNIKLTYTGGRMSLVWDAPVGINGGYIDQAKVVYNVVRVIGGDETNVVTGIAATSFSEVFAEPESMVSVKYNVTAVYLGKESDVASSNSVLVGSGSGISLPYVEDFESDGIINLLTIIDANNDGQTWKIAEKDGNRSARIDCNEKMSMDDWLIMPAVKLQKGVSYSISFKVTTYNSPYFPERLEVFVGNAAKVEAMQSGTQLIEPTVLKNLSNSAIGGTFIPDADGMYYIGLHGISDADMFFIIIDDFTVAEGFYDRGPDIPSVVGNAYAKEISDGQVKISWTAPAVDVNGRPIDSKLTYKIIDSNYRTVVDNLEATEYVYNAVETGEQDFLYYYIGATNEVGTGEFEMTDMIVVGTPYAYPFEESFTDGEIRGIFGVETPEGCNADWEVYTEESGQIPDADGTNGFIGMYGYKVGDHSSLFTGKISLAGSLKPALSFYYNALTADNQNTMEVAVREVGTDEWTILKNFVEEGATEDYEWIKMMLPLEEYKDKVIQLRWTPKMVNYPFGLIDCIKVDEAVSYDLAAKTITAPVRVGANKEFNVNVVIANDGVDTAEGYSVELYRDGEKVQEIAGESIPYASRMNIVFNETLGVTVSEATYNAVVVYAADENNANNSTTSIKVEVKVPAFPTVNDLAANQTSAGVELAWSAPNLSNLPLAAVTEDFEDTELYSQSVNDWTFVDADGAKIGGIQGVTLPFQTASWFVIDYTEPAFGRTFVSHSGTKHMSTMFNLQGEQNDDWMISPALCGDAQTISLWARSYIEDYGLEKMELLYSTTDKSISSFISVKEVEAPAEWTVFTFDVPEGAKYFAIRYTSKDIYMLFVDDITYIPSNASAQNLVIKGYNIYRDGTRINDEPVSATTFVDTTAEDGSHAYVVSVVYEQGESAPSNEVNIVTSGIISINAATNTNTNVYSISGAIMRKGSNSLNGLAKGVYIINGKKVVVK